MKKFTVKYREDVEGKLVEVQVEAFSAQAANQEARSKYSNIDYIVSVNEVQ